MTTPKPEPVRLTKQDIDEMFPDCGHRYGYGGTEHDRNRCESMISFCRARVAHRAWLRLLAAFNALVEEGAVTP